MRIGIFGGSFNPVHNGHVGVAARAVRELELDRLLVVPAAMNPFKVDANVARLPDDLRLELARAAFAPVARTEVDDRELRRGGVSYAVDTVGEIAAENPGARLFFLVGEDSLAGLPRWKDFARLKELCEFRAFPRTRESSTEIRRRLAAGLSVADMVPPRVAEILADRGRFF